MAERLIPPGIRGSASPVATRERGYRSKRTIVSASIVEEGVAVREAAPVLGGSSRREPRPARQRVAQRGERPGTDERQEAQPLEPVRTILPRRVLPSPIDSFLHPFVPRQVPSPQEPLPPARDGVALIVA